MTGDLQEYLQSRQALVDRYLDQECPPGEGCPAALAEAMRYSLLAGGKRLRPILVFLACDAAGGDEQRALPAAAAVEMVHTYSLIHDDLPAMDDDDLRRGRPTCHKAFGEATAILAGDALLTQAFEVLATNRPGDRRGVLPGISPKRRGRGHGRRPGGRPGVGKAGRQPGGLEKPARTQNGNAFRACLRLGLLTAQGERAGGPDAALLQSLDNYGRCFGMIFQITDDLIDVESSAEKTGKRTQKDAARGKLTFPGFLGIEESRRHALELARQAEEHLRPLGSHANRLASLARYVLTRDR